MIGVLIIPTGIEATIGGNAGDANPVAKLIGGVCDKLILHPNVVNAADINEMPANSLYVEGSILDKFLEGDIKLQEVRQNKILVVCNTPATGDTINAVSAARVTIGINAEILELKTPLRMIAKIEEDKATGDVLGYKELIEQVSEYEFDALALHTPIEVDNEIALNYYRNGGINPWGGVEAKASRLIAEGIKKPCAHAPIESVTADDGDLYNIMKETIPPRITPEAVSNCYLHCVLKGLHKAPRIRYKKGLSIEDIDFMVTPYNCWGRPHDACSVNDIPIIVVKENKTNGWKKDYSDNVIIVENYWEAAGIILCMKVGITFESVRAKLKHTKVTKAKKE